MQKSAVAALLAALVLSACSPAQRESGVGEINTPTTSPEEPASSKPAVPDDTQNSEPSDGGFWTFKDNNGETVAIYGYENSDAVFSVRCSDLAEEVVFYRAANAPENSVINMNLLTSEGNTLIRALGETSTLPGFTGRLPNTDPWLEQLAAADTLTINLQGENEITVPVSPELKRVIASCQ